jgi:hypothetical protein
MYSDVIEWLADAQLHHYLSGPLDAMPSPEELSALDPASGQSLHWADRLGYLEAPLDYEPRALAVNRAATKVAVGTKSGAIFIATQNPTTRQWQCVRQPSIAYELGHAIRGLTFLEDNRLVAATGIGELEELGVGAEKSVRLSAGLGQGTSSNQRCTRVLRLPANAPGRAISLTRDGSMFLLRADQILTPEVTSDVLPNWDPTERIIDGRMHALSGPDHDERLVVLGARGTVRVYSWGSDGACQQDCHTRIVPPTATGVFRGLAKWPGGLALLASDYVTCVAYEGSADAPSFGSDEIRPQWLHSPDANSITAWQPFRSAPDGSHAVIVYVGSAVNGMSFVRWHLETSNFELLHRPVRLPVNRRPEGVALVAARTQEHEPDSSAPALLALATWDHRLVITSILDRSFVRRVLTARCRPQVTDPLPPGSTFCHLLADIERFKTAAAPEPQADPGHRSSALARRLRVMEADELVRLADRVIRQVKIPEGAPFEWLLAILERAQELDAPKRRVVHRFIAERLEHAAASAKATPFVMLLWRHFHKWVVQGHTYGQKELSLGWLAHSNRARPLDALQLRTRLLRHRVDSIWRADGPRGLRHRASVWALAVSPLQGEGETRTGCVLQCQDEGTLAITHFELTGRRLETASLPIFPERVVVVGQATRARFISQLLPGRLGEHGLRLTADGTLTRIDSEQFIRQYNFGPYARRLVLLRVPDSTRLVALFSLHGWREADREGQVQRMPHLVMLELHPHVVGNRRDYEIVGIESCALDDELYAIEAVPEPVATPDVTFIVGLAKAARDDRRRVPFLKINAHLSTPIRLETSEVSVDETPHGLPSSYAAAAQAERNECRAVTIMRSPSGRYRLFAGFHNGHIVEYSMASLDQPPTYTGRVIQASSSIRCLAADPVTSLLAYGTAAGTLGAIDISIAPTGALPHHVVHSAERQPLTRVSFIDDGRRRLMSMTQSGTLCLHDVDALDARAVDDGEHVRFPGYRVDRFRVGRRALAVADLPGSPAARPMVLVGDDTGGVTCLDLVLPRGTQRRHEAGEGCDTLWAQYTKEEDRLLPIGMLGRWLRVLELGPGFAGSHMARFSVWRELREVEKQIPDAFLETLKRLSEDAFSRRPFSSETAKVLWEEGGRVARSRARDALEGKGEQHWAECVAIHDVINGICNRWLGQDRTFEDDVLAHSFRHLFAWPYVDLLCSTAESNPARTLRQGLVFGLAQRRLAHAGDLVPLETVKTMNAALIRSIARMVNSPGNYRPASFGGTPNRVALYDLVMLVGQLGRRLGEALGISHPLFSEMARFFAAVLLRAPEHSLLIFQVLSESRLARQHESMAEAVLVHAQRLRVALAPSDGTPSQARLLSAWDVGLRLFELASATEDSTIKQSWKRLREIEVAPGHADSNERSVDNGAILREMKLTFEVAEALAELPRRSSEDALAVISHEATEWLGAEATAKTSAEFYAHTRAYFWKLRVARTALIAARDAASVESGQREALRQCDQEIQKLLTTVDLFEPQRTQYAATILRNWRTLSEEPAARAYQLLHVLNGFNRHVYRAQTDALMTRVVDLALQTSPRWFDKGAEAEAATRFHLETRESLSHNPNVEALYNGVFEIVAESHLVGTLLAVAYEQLFERRRNPPQVNRDSFTTALSHEAAQFDITLNIDDPASEDFELPGAQSVWTAILGELCRNLSRHGVGDLKMATCRVTNTDRLRIAIYGTRPFAESLTPLEYQGLANSTVDERRRDLEARAEACVRRPSSDRPDSDSGGGYGLLMLAFICQLLSLEFACSLESSSDDPLQWPLVSTILGRKVRS